MVPQAYIVYGSIYKKMLKDKIIETENRLVVARTLGERGCRSVDGIVLYLDCNNANVLVLAS